MSAAAGSADPVDLGAADPALLAALIAADEPRILAALPAARLLVAVAAVPGTEHASEGEMALALLESADGTQGLPVFTGLASLAAWRSNARPVPRPAAEIIAYARAEAMAAVVFDPGSPHAYTLWRTAFAADASVAGGADEAAESSYQSPTWKPSRRARRRAAGHEVYALDTALAEPALAVICPDGTLDADWTERLLNQCPAGTSVVALLPTARPAVQEVGVQL